jgi:hypothetical protein
MEDNNTIDLRDFTILADGWETDYDMNDLKIMADKWLWVTEPNIQLQISGDANNGFLTFGTTGYTYNTQRIFLLVDGEYTGEIFGFRDGLPLGIDISEYGGGEKQLKAVSINSAGQVNCSNITITEFNCPLNYCFLPSEYEPNKPLYFSAFNPTEGNVSVNVYADCGNLVWSQDYNGVSLSGYIPAEITAQHEIDYVKFDVVGGGLICTGAGASILKPVPPAPDPCAGDIRALIILPFSYVNRIRVMQIIAVRKAFIDRGIKSQILGPKSATSKKIYFYVLYNPIKYMYVLAHGGYKLGDVLRTFVVLSDGRAVSVKKSDFTSPYDVPAWCKDMNSWETKVNSFVKMGLKSEKIKFAYFDSCESGRLVVNEHNQLIEGKRMQIGFPATEELYSDMSWALGIHESIFESHAYEGWYEKVPVGNPPTKPETDYQQWTRDMWERLGAGDTLAQALFFTAGRQTNWTDPNAPVNTYRMKAQWDFLNIKLE